MARNRRRTPRRRDFRPLAVGLTVAAAATVLLVGVLLVRTLGGSHGQAAGQGRLSDSTLPAQSLGPGWRAQLVAGAAPDWPWAQDGACPSYSAADYPAQRHRLSA